VRPTSAARRDKKVRMASTNVGTPREFDAEFRPVS
jgi:hypothetical protein